MCMICLLFASVLVVFIAFVYEVFVFVDTLPNYDASFPSNSLFLQSLSCDTNVML
jgi:hypothetical protein